MHHLQCLVMLSSSYRSLYCATCVRTVPKIVFFVLYIIIKNVCENFNGRSYVTFQSNYSIHLLNAIGLTPSASSTVHIYTQIIHRTTQLIWEECGPCPVFASYTLAFALQLREKHRKTSVRVAEECQLARWKQNIQNRRYITITIHKHNNNNT
jgi:hypothetical protein